jgi:hypothetical protein
MASSPGVTSAVNSYLSTGQSSGLYTLGASAFIAAGINPIQQFVGSYTYTITPGNGGLNVSHERLVRQLSSIAKPPTLIV